MRLYTVELRRLFARRTFRLLMAGAVALFVVVVGMTAWNSQPPTEDELAFAQQQVDEQKEFVARDIEECEAHPRDWGLSDGDECAAMLDWEPTVDQFYYSNIFSFADEMQYMLPTIGGMALLLAFVIGASFIGAEWSSGMMATHLTWEPRRGRVLAAKTVTVAVVVAVLTALLMAASIAAFYWVAATWGTTDRTTGDVVVGFIIDALRATGLAAAFAAGGAAVAGILRSTVGALVAAAAYALVGEGLIRAVWPASDRWLLSHNAIAWLDDGFRHERWDCSSFAGECESIVTNITLVGGAAVLGVVIVAAVALHAVTFARRDVV